MSFFRSLLWAVSVASAFTKSFRSSSHLFASLAALLWVLADLSSPGFHSAAFLVHLSLLCVDFRRACRHFSFYFFLYETKLSPPTRQTSENKKERSAPRWRLSTERNQVLRAFTTVLSKSAAQARARLCQHVFVSFFCASFYEFNPAFEIIFMACCVFSSSSSNEYLLSWSHSLCVLISSSSLLADFVVTNVFSSSFLLDFVFSFSFV